RAPARAAPGGGGQRAPGVAPHLRRAAGRVRQGGRGLGHRPRPPRGERLRLRVPDGADEPPAPSLARDGVPPARGGPYLPQLEPGAPGRPLRRPRRSAGPPAGRPGPARAPRRVSVPGALLGRAAARRARLVLCEGGDERVRAAAERLAADGIAEVLLLDGPGRAPADDPRLQAVADHLRARRPDRVRDGIHALDLAADPLRFGAGLVGLGEADGCVAGAQATTADVIRAALWAIGTAPTTPLVSSAFYMVHPDGRVLTFTDCAVVPDPDPAQLAGIALAAVHDRARLVGDEPRVAFLSYATRGSAGGPAVDRVREAVARFRELAPGTAAD